MMLGRPLKREMRNTHHSDWVSPRIWLFFCAVGILSFVAFMAIAATIGGDALSGYSEGGHYYLRNHAQITEVSRSVFLYSRWHSISVFITHPLAIFSGIMFFRRFRQIR
jgi:hypothetical protein